MVDFGQEQRAVGGSGIGVPLGIPLFRRLWSANLLSNLGLIAPWSLLGLYFIARREIG
jgi:hypothetical protein